MQKLLVMMMTMMIVVVAGNFSLFPLSRTCIRRLTFCFWPRLVGSGFVWIFSALSSSLSSHSSASRVSIGLCASVCVHRFVFVAHCLKEGCLVCRSCRLDIFHVIALYLCATSSVSRFNCILCARHGSYFRDFVCIVVVFFNSCN